MPRPVSTIPPIIRILLICALGLGLISRPALPGRAAFAHTTHAESGAIFLPIAFQTYPRPANIFGIETYSFVPTRIADVNTLGARWQRHFVLDWSLIEPVRTEPPVYDWSSVNEAGLMAAPQNQVRIIATVKNTPTWARKVADKRCSAPGPDHIGAFAQFLQAAAARYGALPYNLHYYEIGNEVDVDPIHLDGDSPFGCWGDESDKYYGGGYYADILKQVTPAIKSADPQAQVLTGGFLLNCDPTNPLSGNICKPARYLEGILRNGGAPYFDIVSYHMFGYYTLGLIDEGSTSWNPRGGGFYGKISFLREVLAQYRVSKPLFLTETSLLCHEGNPSCSPVSEDFLQKQANFVVWAYIRGWASNLQGVSWYTYEDSGWRSSGLYNRSVRKPAYTAYQFMAHYLGDARLAGQISVAPDIIAYEFHLPDKRVWVLWSATQTDRPLTLPAQTAAMFNILGQPMPLAPTMMINNPVYLELVP